MIELEERLWRVWVKHGDSWGNISEGTGAELADSKRRARTYCLEDEEDSSLRIWYIHAESAETAINTAILWDEYGGPDDWY